MEEIKKFVLNNVGKLSLISFGAVWSVFTFFHAYYKDRKRVKTSSKFYKGSESIHVKIVNVGKRQIILTRLTFKHEDGSIHGRVLGHPNGLTLKQDEMWEDSFEFGSNSSTLYCIENDTGATMHLFAIDGLRIGLISGMLVTLLRVLQVSRGWCGAVAHAGNGPGQRMVH
jgi:hypothetical protein